jgi:arabinofuranosyltransferase
MAICMVAFGTSIVNCAWVCDDAYITFRTIDNWVNGFGLRWNIAERVQSFTHPLWLFLITPAYLLLGNIYYASVILSLILSAASVWLVLRVFGDHWLKTLWMGLAFALSKAFVDYSTSGLENPLSHLLLVAFLVVYLQSGDANRTVHLSLLAGLAMLNRLDSILLIAPALLYSLMNLRRQKALRAVLIGFAPLLVWFAFAFFYYGSPLPNTAFAKLSTGGARTMLLGMGLDYFVHSAGIDPITLSIILAALIVIAIRRDQPSLLIAIGIVLHCVYLVWIGGDFMSGRFLTTVYLAAVVLICHPIGEALLPIRPALIGVVLLPIVTSASPLWRVGTTFHLLASLRALRMSVRTISAVPGSRRSGRMAATHRSQTCRSSWLDEKSRH